MYSIDTTLNHLQGIITKIGYHQTNLEYFLHDDLRITRLTDKGELPTIILFCDRNSNDREKRVSLASLCFVHSQFNILFIEHLAKKFLTIEELYFVIGHELNHAIKGEEFDEYSADAQGVELSSVEAAISTLNKLTTISKAITDKYSINSLVDEGELQSRFFCLDKLKSRI